MPFSHIWKMLQKKKNIQFSAYSIGLSGLGNGSNVWGLSIVLIALKLIQ